MTKRKKAHSLRLTEYWPVQKEISWSICLLGDILSHPHLCKLSGVSLVQRWWGEFKISQNLSE